MPRRVGPRFSVYKKTTLAGGRQVITIQQPAAELNSRRIYFEYVQVHCTVACVVEIERDGTPATATALTPTDVSKHGPITAKAWSESNVGAGTKITEFDVPANATVPYALDGFMLKPGGGPGENLTFRSSPLTGDFKITVVWREEG